MSAEKLFWHVLRGYPRLSHSRHAFYCVASKDKLRRCILQWSGGPWSYAPCPHNATILPFHFITPCFGRHFSTGPPRLFFFPSRLVFFPVRSQVAKHSRTRKVRRGLVGSAEGVVSRTTPRLPRHANIIGIPPLQGRNGHGLGAKMARESHDDRGGD